MKSFQDVGNLFREQAIRFADRRPISIMNHVEWYKSKSWSASKTCMSLGLRLRMAPPAPYCCGITVPRMEAPAIMIRSVMVNLTEERKGIIVFLISNGTLPLFYLIVG